MLEYLEELHEILKDIYILRGGEITIGQILCGMSPNGKADFDNLFYTPDHKFLKDLKAYRDDLYRLEGY